MSVWVDSILGSTQKSSSVSSQATSEDAQATLYYRARSVTVMLSCLLVRCPQMNLTRCYLPRILRSAICMCVSESAIEFQLSKVHRNARSVQTPAKFDRDGTPQVCDLVNTQQGTSITMPLGRSRHGAQYGDPTLTTRPKSDGHGTPSPTVYYLNSERLDLPTKFPYASRGQ